MPANSRQAQRLAESHAGEFDRLLDEANSRIEDAVNRAASAGSTPSARSDLSAEVGGIIAWARAKAYDMALGHTKSELRALVGSRLAREVELSGGPEPLYEEIARYVDDASNVTFAEAETAHDDKSYAALVIAGLYRYTVISETETAKTYGGARNHASASIVAYVRDKEASDPNGAPFRVATTPAEVRVDNSIVYRWCAVNDRRTCEDCAMVDGELQPLGGSFSIDGPPAHPRCRCIAVLWMVGLNWRGLDGTQTTCAAHGRGCECGEGDMSKSSKADMPPKMLTTETREGVVRMAVGIEPMHRNSVNERLRTAEFVASTESTDAHGTRILASAWDLTRFNSNPVFLSVHDSARIKSVIGRGIATQKGKKLVLKAEFAPAEVNDEAETAWKMVKGDWIRAVSVGFMPKEWHEDPKDGAIVFDRVELVEVSLVPVPSNKDALLRQLRGADTQTREVVTMTDETTLEDVGEVTPAELSTVVPATEERAVDASATTETPSPVAAPSEPVSEPVKVEATETRDAELELRLDAVTRERDALKAEVEAFRADKAERETRMREAEVDALISSKRLAPEKRASALSLLEKSPEQFRDIYPPDVAAPYAYLLKEVVGKEPLGANDSHERTIQKVASESALSPAQRFERAQVRAVEEAAKRGVTLTLENTINEAVKLIASGVC